MAMDEVYSLVKLSAFEPTTEQAPLPRFPAITALHVAYISCSTLQHFNVTMATNSM